jgi:hypothetical protein
MCYERCTLERHVTSDVIPGPTGKERENLKGKFPHEDKRPGGVAAP